jgi:hypothetical protein
MPRRMAAMEVSAAAAAPEAPPERPEPEAEPEPHPAEKEHRPQAGAEPALD